MFCNSRYNFQTENGLVEAVAVLVSTMPRLRPDLPSGKLGQCYQTRPDFIKVSMHFMLNFPMYILNFKCPLFFFLQAWEKWRGQVSKLDYSAFWVQCHHHKTSEGLRKLLRILLGQIGSLNELTSHWVELFVSHFEYVQPFIIVCKYSIWKLISHTYIFIC